MSNRRLSTRPLEDDDVDLWERYWCAEAREDFYAFRKFTRPKILDGWWQREVAKELMQFWRRWKNHERPVLILQAPPQHGKSEQITDFVAWAAGHDPSLNTIYGSYSEHLGIKANLYLQRMLDSDNYRKVFPNTRLKNRQMNFDEGQWIRNTHHFEYVWQDGGFRNVTVGGQVTGMGLHLGIVDDPIKGRAEASSPIVRESTWNWLTDDFYTRFSDEAALLLMMTRWHLDDPAGRLLHKFPHARVCRYPAIAEKDEKYRKKGEPLFPQLKSLEFILERKGLLTQAGFESVYQQNPIVVGGDLFPIEKIGFEKAMPARRDIKKSVRYWDKAGTEGGTGARTAGVLMHELQDHTFLVEHVVSGRWSAMDREARIKQTCQLDNSEGRITETWVEQEPGSGGKESAESTVRNLRGWVCFPDRVTGSKEIRAEPYAAQVQGGNVKLLEAPWNRDFLDEHELFPNGKYKDMVDASGGAFAKLTLGSTYDSSMRWVTGV